MKKARSTILVVLLAAAVAIITSCGSGVRNVGQNTNAPLGQEQPSNTEQKPPGAPDKLVIAVPTFLSGPAAAPFGVPLRNAAEIIAEALNAGNVPPPYNKPGIGGVPLELKFIDESGGTEKQAAEYRRLVQDEKVDVVVGYISSANCLTVAPIAEELQKLTVFVDCGTHQVFEERSYKYVFRTSPHQVLENVATARYVVDTMPNVSTVAGINQDYAFGHDSWDVFKESIKQLKPDVQIVGEYFPKQFVGQYGAEISALLTAKPTVTHSSFWGGDLESFILQSVPRGLHNQTLLVFTTGETVLERLGEALPPGVVVAAKGPYGFLAPENELNTWLKQKYRERFKIHPTYPAYKIVDGLLGLKMAWEKAIDANGGKWPTQEQVIQAFEGLEFPTPSGGIKMALANGHQAITGAYVAMTGDGIDPRRVPGSL